MSNEIDANLAYGIYDVGLHGVSYIQLSTFFKNNTRVPMLMCYSDQNYHYGMSLIYIKMIKTDNNPPVVIHNNQIYTSDTAFKDTWTYEILNNRVYYTVDFGSIHSGWGGAFIIMPITFGFIRL